MRLAFCSGFMLATAVCLAQSWEVGGAAGVGLSRDVTVTSGSGQARAGFSPGLAFGAFLGQDLRNSIGGEIRYMFRADDLRLSSGGTKVTFGGQSHLIYYDVLFYAKTGRRSKLRPFLSVGAGARLFQGTGEESAYQPLWQYALLTRTHEVKPLVSVGAGIKATLGKRLLLRLEFHDYMSPFPTQVIAPSPGAKLGGWWQDWLPQAGVSYSFK